MPIDLGDFGGSLNGAPIQIGGEILDQQVT